MPTVQPITATANHCGHEHSLAPTRDPRFPGDVAAAISTSENSPSIDRAVHLRTQAGLFTVALAAALGGRLRRCSDRRGIRRDSTHTGVPHSGQPRSL